MLRRTLVLAALAMAATAALVATVITRPRVVKTTEFPYTIVDDEGLRTTLGHPPGRVVSFAPQFTETLLALGAEEKIAGVSGAETNPPEALTLTPLTAADGISPDIDRIQAIKADLLVTSGSAGASWKTTLRQAEVPVVTLNASSFIDALDDIRKVGSLVGMSGAASNLSKKIDEEVRALPTPSRNLEVFVEVFNSPLTASGTRGFVADLVRRGGGIPSGPVGDFAEVTLDAIVAFDPDIYVAVRTSAASSEEILQRPGFDRLRAVREGRIFIVSDDLLLRPGPNMASAVAVLARSFSHTE